MKKSKKLKKFEKATIPDNIINRMKWLKEFIDNLTGEADINAISTIHSVADEYMDGFINKYTTCDKGCSYCCRVEVEVPALEAIYIHNALNEPINVDIEKVKIPENSPCKFLKKDICSIYEYRPLVCRMFGSLDSLKKCKTGKDHFLISIKSSDFWLGFVSKWLYLNSSNLKSGTLNIPIKQDIRKWFLK